MCRKGIPKKCNLSDVNKEADSKCGFSNKEIVACQYDSGECLLYRYFKPDQDNVIGIGAPMTCWYRKGRIMIVSPLVLF